MLKFRSEGCAVRGSDPGGAGGFFSNGRGCQPFAQSLRRASINLF